MTCSQQRLISAWKSTQSDHSLNQVPDREDCSDCTNVSAYWSLCWCTSHLYVLCVQIKSINYIPYPWAFPVVDPQCFLPVCCTVVFGIHRPGSPILSTRSFPTVRVIFPSEEVMKWGYRKATTGSTTSTSPTFHLYTGIKREHILQKFKHFTRYSNSCQKWPMFLNIWATTWQNQQS